MKNNKGYTLVEVLAVIVIIGIIATVGVIAYTRYIAKTRQDAYDTLAKSAYHAAQEYVMDDETATNITLQKLVEDNYLENYKDPTGSGNCDNSEVTIDIDSYKVKLCCKNYSYEYSFPGGIKSITTCD